MVKKGSFAKTTQKYILWEIKYQKLLVASAGQITYTSQTVKACTTFKIFVLDLLHVQGFDNYTLSVFVIACKKCFGKTLSKLKKNITQKQTPLADI